MDDLKQFFTTEEVALHFEVAPSKIRFYEREFNMKIKTVGKNKAFSRKDIEYMASIIKLVDEDNFTLQGAKEQLKKSTKTDRSHKEAIEILEGVKAVLLKMRG